MSLNVIALISGGKDSIYSILHVQSLGHKVVALGNLYPASISPTSSSHDGDDPDSHMYQTAGHSLIPKIAECLGLPLYRRELQGTNVSKGATYVKPRDGEGKDETEDLDVLLKIIMEEHPEANAVSSGAILSTYQRTRVETVSIRLGLVPLAYLWQYTALTTEEAEDALLKHMEIMGLEARIVKVASGGLGEEDLWQDVAGYRGRERIKKKIMRFGEGEGAVIGEGGEFETLCLDGPHELWKRRLMVEEEDRVVVAGEGGVASMAFRHGAGEVVKKEKREGDAPELPEPKMLEAQFKKVLAIVSNDVEKGFSGLASDTATGEVTSSMHKTTISDDKPTASSRYDSTVNKNDKSPFITLSHSAPSMASLLSSLSTSLECRGSTVKDVISTTLLIRDMSSFPEINKEYSSLFSHVNPPSRACVAVGGLLDDGIDVLMHCCVATGEAKEGRTALHVQSRSYWAPANIGPYSQAQSFFLSRGDEEKEEKNKSRGIHIAGQIPLAPAKMAFTTDFIEQEKAGKWWEKFCFEATLAAQHLWRIGRAMDVQYFTSGTAFLPRCAGPEEAKARALIAGRVWAALHATPKDDDEDGSDEDVDLWELRNRRGEESMGAKASIKTLPDWERVKFADKAEKEEVSPFWAAEVETLPMNADVEWVPGMGVSGTGIEALTTVHVDGGAMEAHRVRLADGECVVTVFVYQNAGLRTVERFVEETMDLAKRNAPGHVFDASRDLEWSAEKAYLDVQVMREWGSVPAGVVPCMSLWDKEERRLDAVVVVRV